MAQVSIRWDGNGIARLATAMQAVAGSKKVTVLRRALNHTGDKTFTTVKRTLARVIGTSQGVLMRYGRVRNVRANNARLEYLIVSNGGPIPLKHFAAYQTRKGVSAAPWRNRKIYRGAFIVGSLGGHVFWRTSLKRLPIERVAGPNVPKEMVKDTTAAAFQATVAANLPARVAHEIKVLTNGVVS